jgi:hypothetical protein
MMKKRWITGLLTFMIAGVATTALGDSLLKITIDGKRISADISAAEANGVIDLVNKLGGFVDYNRKSGEFEVEKPEVNILVLEGAQQFKNKDVVLSNPIRSYSDKGVPRTFNVFVEVDNAPVSDDLKLQVVLIGPNGKVVEDGKVKPYNTKKGTSFYFSEPFISTKLEDYGTYKVQVKMKTDNYDSYVVVGENSFTVGR